MTMTTKKIFVTGAGGQLGQLVIDALRSRASTQDIVAGVRSLDKPAAYHLNELGIELRHADYQKPDTLASALRGVDHLLLISSGAGQERAGQHQKVIDAARKAGVTLIAYTSILHADTSILPLASEHLSTEHALHASGVPFVVLRNSWYTENYLMPLKAAMTRGAILGSAGAGRISAASRRDYAEAAAVVLTTEGHSGRTYELAGDNFFTMADFCAAASLISGKNVTYRDLPQNVYAEALAGLGLPIKIATMLAECDTGIARDGLFNEDRQLSGLIGRPTTTYTQSITEMLARLV